MSRRSLWWSEWKLLASERTPWLLLALFVLVMGYGAWNGHRWASFQQTTLDTLLAADETRLARLDSLVQRVTNDSTVTVPPAGALGATGATRHAILPVPALAPLAVGVSDLHPYYARVSVRSKETFSVNDEIENPHNLLVGRFDLSFVIVYVFPLFLLALTYNVVSGERDRGTMALWMAQPVAPRRLLLVKLAVRVGYVLAVTALLLILCAMAVGIPLDTMATWTRLALWMGVALAYGAFWMALVLAVNALGRSSATNAVPLLGAWLLTVVVLPSTIAAAIVTVHPAPSRIALTTALRETSDQAAAQGDTAVNQFLADHPEMLQTGSLKSSNTWARTLALQERTADAMRPTYAAFDSALAAQQQAARVASFLSPAVVTQELLYEVAGRGMNRLQRYQQQIDGFHQEWQRFFFGRVFRDQRFTAADLTALPRFVFQEQPVRAAFAEWWGLIAALVLPTVLIGSWAFRRLRRITITG